MQTQDSTIVAPGENQLTEEAGKIISDVKDKVTDTAGQVAGKAEKLVEDVKSELKTETAKEDKRILPHISKEDLYDIAVVVIATFLLLKALNFVFAKLAQLIPDQKFKVRLKQILPILKVVVLSICIYVIVVNIINPSPQALFAAAGSIAVAVGFALRDIASNFIAGITILFDRPFHVGDKIQTKEYYGEVIDIGLRKTQIVTPGDSVVSVPNSIFVNEAVSSGNFGAIDMMVIIDFYLDHGVDLDLVKNVVWEGVMTSPYVYLKKPVTIIVKEREYSTQISAKAYVYDARYEFNFMSEVTEGVKEEFQSHGIKYVDINVMRKLEKMGKP